MKPDPFALINLPSRIGSPAKNGERTIEPVSSSIAFARSVFLMKVGPAATSGHICQERSAALTAVPMGISPFATSTSTVSSWVTGLGGSGSFRSPPASRAARPPAARAIPRTTRRAAFIRFTFQVTRRPGWPSLLQLFKCGRCRLVRRISPVKRQGMVNEAYPNSGNEWLTQRKWRGSGLRHRAPSSRTYRDRPRAPPRRARCHRARRCPCRAAAPPMSSRSARQEAA